uniref:Protein RETICULATA-RELATED 1, chloroplastic n=1 Tax=Noccaea caerulescens TaxID=107243 RepID=A0A1J3CRG7_NOCCA
MSLSLKVSHISNFSNDCFNSKEPRNQCRAGQRLEIRSICFRRSPGIESRRIHLNSELSSRKLRTQCVGSDVVAGEISGRSVPGWTYSGLKDETLSDLEPELDGGDGDGGDDGGNNDRNGNGGNGGGGGDGGDDGEDEADKAEEKEFGPILKLDEVMKETERRGIKLPEDMLEAAKSVGIRKLFLLRYLDLQGSVWPLGFLMRTCSMLRNRMLADPSFLFKVGTEVAIDSCCATFAEVQKRGENFWSEFELYAADLLVGLVVDVALVGLLAPYARIGKPSVASSTGLFKGLKRSCAALPSSVFEAERPGCKFSVNQRIATFFYKGLLYGSVGFGCGLVGQGIANLIMTAKRSIKKSEEDVPVPPLFESAALWGVFLGLSSNARYQIINGLERVVEGSTAAKRIPVVAMAFTVGVRFANNVYGGMQFVDWAKLSGVQ